MPALCPSGDLCVIGDIHGRADLLDQVLEQIEAKGRFRDGLDKLVFLGDYIDRGEDSRAVLHRLLALSQDRPDQVVCLAGNHETMLLRFLDHPEASGRAWLRNGGLQTLASFGIGGVSEASDASTLQETRDRLKGCLPDETEQWLRGLPLLFQSGNLCAVHAALDPAQPLEDQSENTLLWGCPAFGQSPRTDGLWVIHGHTIVDQPEIKNGVISIDTGAFATGRLSAALIERSGDVRFL